MGRQITGESAHEWLGAGIFILWIIHHILNFKWHRHLAKGKYTPFRVIQVVVNLLLLLAMIGTMVSAVILSREVFAFYLFQAVLHWLGLCTFYAFSGHLF